MHNFTYHCSMCNKSIKMPNLYVVKIKDKNTGHGFQSDICPHCYCIIISILKGGLTNESNDNN